MANNVVQTKGSIGYVEYAYAKQNKMTFANMINKDGKAVAPELKSFQAAAASADWKSVPGFGVILTDQAGGASWPITAATFILMQKIPVDLDASKGALKFFDWAYKNGDKAAEELDYIPLPDAVVELRARGLEDHQGCLRQSRVCNELELLCEDRGGSAVPILAVPLKAPLGAIGLGVDEMTGAAVAERHLTLVHDERSAPRPCVASTATIRSSKPSR